MSMDSPTHPLPVSGYRRLARKAGLKLFLDRDISRQSLPTYDFLRLSGKLLPGRSEHVPVANAVNGWMEGHCCKGRYRYRILGFEPA